MSKKTRTLKSDNSQWWAAVGTIVIAIVACFVMFVLGMLWAHSGGHGQVDQCLAGCLQTARDIVVVGVH